MNNFLRVILLALFLNISDVYASVYDIVYWFNYGKSYYGRQLTFDPETGKHRCVEVEDAAAVDKRRAEIGLPPVWAFCKKYNITPPANLVSNARVTAVRCTEDDYNEAKKSIFLALACHFPYRIFPLPTVCTSTAFCGMIFSPQMDLINQSMTYGGTGMYGNWQATIAILYVMAQS